MVKLEEETYRGYLIIDKGHSVVVRRVLAPGEGFTRQQFEQFFGYHPGDQTERTQAVVNAKHWIDEKGNQKA